MKPIIKELEGGDWVVDLGRTWFRVYLNGRVVVRRVWRGKVKTSEASPTERVFAFKKLNQAIAR